MHMLKNEKGLHFIYIGLMGAVVLAVVAGGLLYIAKKSIVKEDAPTAEIPVEKPKSEEDRPVTDFQPYKDAYDVSGEWLGSYIVTAPEECAGEKGGWTATLTQTGTAISGKYSSDEVSGLISGGAIIGEDVSWKVNNDQGDITFSGHTASPNSIDGTFVGRVCHEEYAPVKTSGEFFGGRLVE